MAQEKMAQEKMAQEKMAREKMAKDHGPSVKNDKQYEGLRKKGMSRTCGEDREHGGGFEQGGQGQSRRLRAE
jgi:hypothetical protein